MATRSGTTKTQSGSRLTGQDAINIALMSQDISNIKNHLDNIDSTLRSDFVKKDEFEPVKNLVYGFVILIVVGVVGALLALVIIHPGQLTTSVTASGGGLSTTK